MQSLNIWLRRLFVSVLTVALIALTLHAVEIAARHMNMAMASAAAKWIGDLVHAHQDALVLLVLAAVSVMPTELPPPLNRVPTLVWIWSWFSGSVRQWVNMQHPGIVVSHVEQHDSPGGSSTVTDKTTIPAPVKEEAK